VIPPLPTVLIGEETGVLMVVEEAVIPHGRSQNQPQSKTDLAEKPSISAGIFSSG